VRTFPIFPSCENNVWMREKERGESEDEYLRDLICSDFEGFRE
jgi:hypothetical protein